MNETKLKRTWKELEETIARLRQANRKIHPDSAGKMGRMVTILYVEDDKNDFELFREYLNDAGTIKLIHALSL